ncbi:22373_t:CDS:10, partial [Dentiscutata erythropus]
PYHPRNIMEDKPSDQSSRWSSKSNDQMQYVLIKIVSMAIVRILFIKQPIALHLENIIKVYGGLTSNNMIELLHSGLRNNSRSETFRLKHRTNQVLLPCQYIKIVPLAAYGPDFNFSIWYIELKGVQSPEIVQQFRENEAIRLCLKHFRQRNYLDAFNALQSKTKTPLEDPFITELYEQIVSNGDFQMAEDTMINAAEKGLFDEYIRNCPYNYFWKKIEATDACGVSPCTRGGHQMCIDVEAGQIYLLGGWDGNNNLADFWSYDINPKKWNLISHNTREQGGPGPRSNHKICLDHIMKRIYVFGRFIGRGSRANANFNSDFYSYDIINNQWIKLCDNTALVGGPSLIYDHQMCIDSEAQMIYVFGGRTVHPDTEPFTYSGLYSYNIRSNEWKLIRSNDESNSDYVPLKSRIGHSMLLDQNEKLLFIIGGDRDNTFLNDFLIYDINAGLVHELIADYATQEDHDSVFTQRTTFDMDTQEFYVLSGLKDKRDKRSQTIKNSFWVYDLRLDKWTKIYQSEVYGAQYWESDETIEPRPRYAHQMVYDNINKVQYVFGGRAVETDVLKQQRLDDFWELHLVRPKPEDLLRRIQFQIRKQKEMCYEGDTVKALKYLQVQLSQVVDHSIEAESAEFRELTSYLFHNIEDKTPSSFNLRTELFENLLEFFPDTMKQPKDNLIDLVKIE